MPMEFKRQLLKNFEYVKKNKHLNFGLPFLIFVVGGSFVLREFASVRYEFRKVNPFHIPEQEEALKSKVDPNEESDKMLKKLNTESWENKRVSRPWEKETQK